MSDWRCSQWRAPLCARAAATFHEGGRPPPGRPFVRRAKPADAQRLADDLREADRSELAAIGRGPLEALQEAVALSRAPMTVIGPDERLILMFGVAPSKSFDDRRGVRVGAPWMLASPALASISGSFLRACRGWTAHLGEPFDL